MNRHTHQFINDYQAKFSKRLLDMEECVSELDCQALGTLVKSIARKGMKIVEVGSWKGLTTSVLAQNVGKNDGRVYAVDHWQGNDGTWQTDITEKYDVFSIFRQNMELLGFQDTVLPLVMSSDEALRLFNDESFDLVFIDADHRYKYVKSDISHWLAKVKPGGILCGHDCEVKYTQLQPIERIGIDSLPDVDTCSGLHVGVIRALYEELKDEFQITPLTRIWHYKKGDKGGTNGH